MNLVCTQAPQTGLLSVMQPAPSAEPTPEDRSAEFRAVEGGGETTSGMSLMVQAYAAFWVLAFALIFMSMRKQKKLDARIAQLQGDLSKARAAGPTAGSDHSDGDD